MNHLPAVITELPCHEVKPFKPFPFQGARISRGIKFKHYLILFPFHVEYKKCQHLYTFNLETLEWSSVELASSPEILESTSNYTILPYLENQFAFFGCYKTFATAPTNNLFSQLQTATLKKVLGFINAEIIEGQGQLSLAWEDAFINKEFPYLERFSASIYERSMFIFGGSDENGNVTNRLIKFDLETGKQTVIGLYNKRDGTEENIPWARTGHTSFVFETKLYIFGGEDKDSNMICDLWELAIKDDIGDDIACQKIEKSGMTRRPKVGTPSLHLDKCRYYIAKESTATVPPIRSFLCADQIIANCDYVSTFYSKKHLPFNGIPHTMELFQNYIIMGYESSIYYISLDERPLEPSSPAMNLDLNMMGMTNRKKPKNYKEYMREYFEERPYPDVVFKVQEEEISAHKGILSVRSRFFYDLFTNEDTRDKTLIEISDLSPSTFTRLLEWVYCDNVMELKDIEAVELLRVGDKYAVRKLKEDAEKYLVRNVTIENVLERAKLAVEANTKDLVDAVVKFAVKEIDEVKKRGELEKFPPEILDRINKAKK